MLRGYVCVFGVTRYCCRKPRRNKEPEEASMSMNVSSQQDLTVRIIHAGGIIERYEGVVRASRLMEKYPKMCIAKPEVFKKPHESIIRADEYLLPGQKFYLVPQSTMKKLKRKHPEEFQVGNDKQSNTLEYMDRKEMLDSESGEDSDESVCSAKDFYVSRERWSRCVQGSNKPFTPPIKKVKMWNPIGWQPSLDSVEEVSP